MRISEEYRKEQEALHATGKYGTASIGYAPFVSQVVNELNVEHLLDYGCGSLTNLLKHMDVKHKFRYQAYDPAVEEYSGDPVPAQMVACIDVLEHIEPEHLDEVFIRVFNPHESRWYYTDPAYMWYRNCMLDMVAESDNRTYNCTEGGILFGDNIDYITLSGFLEIA